MRGGPRAPCVPRDHCSTRTLRCGYSRRPHFGSVAVRGVSQPASQIVDLSCDAFEQRLKFARVPALPSNRGRHPCPRRDPSVNAGMTRGADRHIAFGVRVRCWFAIVPFNRVIQRHERAADRACLVCGTHGRRQFERRPPIRYRSPSCANTSTRITSACPTALTYCTARTPASCAPCWSRT